MTDQQPRPDRLRVGIAGTGFIGRVHGRSARLAGADLVGVAASTPARAADAARVMGADRAYDDAEAMIADPAIDVVHICTPNHLHVPMALAALEAGKHVVCEKPLGRDAAEAQSLVAAAQAGDRLVTVPFVYRFYPTVREARARVRDGAIGDVRLLHGTYLQDWLSQDGDWNWRVDPALGGASRAFADIGSHWCDLVEFVSGERIASLVATMTTSMPERAAATHAEAFGSGDATGERTAVDTEDVAMVLFRTASGVPGSVVISQVSPGRKNRLWFEVDGSAAAVSFDQEAPETLWVGGRSGNTLLHRDADLLGADGARYATTPGGHPQGYADAFDAFVADTYAAIAGDKPDGLPTHVDGLRAARITDAVIASARTGTWVDVPA